MRWRITNGGVDKGRGRRADRSTKSVDDIETLTTESITNPKWDFAVNYLNDRYIHKYKLKWDNYRSSAERIRETRVSY